MENLYSRITNPIHSSFNHFSYYFQIFENFPNLFESKISIKEETIEKIKEISEKIVFENIIQVKNKRKTVEKIKEIVFLYKDCLICFSIGSGYNFYSKYKFEYYSTILYQKESTLQEIKNKFEYQNQKNTNLVNLLCRSEEELYLQKFKVVLPKNKLNLELNYGKAFLEKNNKLIKYLNSNQSGLAMFSGPPGTGKSTYIKYLATKVNRKIIYMPSGSVEAITSPEFLSFITNHKNSILLLEDAEKVLMNREINNNSGVSNILNISDGLLGDCLKIFIIATFNTDRESIDPALLRKGRLFLEHEFDKLSPEDANKIFKDLKSEKTTTIPMSLAEIYNDEDENYVKVVEKRKLGF